MLPQIQLQSAVPEIQLHSVIPQIQLHPGVPHIQVQAALPQIQVREEHELAAAAAEEEATAGDEEVPDQPRILYQCGDCEKLFKSLDLWQQHRKENCQQAVSDSGANPEPQPELEPETVPAESAESTLNPGDCSLSAGETKQSVEAEETERAVVKEERMEEEIQISQGSEATDAADAVDVTDAANAADATAPAEPNSEDSSPRKRGTNKKPKPEPVLLCVDCGSCFGMVSELVSHRKTQHGFEEALHRCSVCGECFLNTTLFLYHRKQHKQKGEGNAAVPGTAAPRQAAQEVGVQGGEAAEEGQDAAPSLTQPPLFLCTLCGRNFASEAKLVDHRGQSHDLHEPLHSCMDCGEVFMNTTKYLYHRRQHLLKPETEVEDEGDTGDEEEAAAAATAAVPEEPSQSSKRPLSPSAAEFSSPIPKRGRPSFRIVSGGNGLKANKVSGSKEKPDLENANQPPPAKLLQDWARTPLPHVCPYCGKTFTRRVFLRAHVFSHTGEKLFTCKVCPKSFANSQSLLRHSMTHTGHKPFKCDVCCKSFSQAPTLKRHQRIHTSTMVPRKRGRKPVCSLDNDEAVHGFPCPSCPSRFSTEDQLNHHRLLHTSHPFPCTECGEAFKRRKELDLHSLMHQDKKPATCTFCTSQFVNQAVLEIHQQRCPTTEEERRAGRGRGQGRGRSTGQIECDLCGHRCMTQEGLDLHRLSHTGQTPLKCPVRPCRRRFTSNAALEEHVLAHFQGTLSKSKNRPRFRCQYCHKEFAYNSTFKVHMRTHTDERPFECATCGKRFRQLPHLQDHERIHSGQRPFCCWICGKSFSVAARLTEHARTHSGEKPYPCGYCSAAFRSRSNLDKHMRLHGDLMDSVQEAAQAAEVAQVQKVLEGANLVAAEDGAGGGAAVQTIYVLQGAEGTTETVMIPSDQISGLDGTSQVVILPSSLLGAQGIAVPTITMDGNEITMVETSQSPQHAIEFIVEETV